MIAPSRLLFVAICLLSTPTPTLAETRVALVIGNSAYRHAPALANPRNDAEGMASSLRRLGFDVVAGIDLDKAAMERSLQAFAAKLDGADVALVFYAGHGLQVHGRNYLVPVDGKLDRESDLLFQAVPLDLVQSLLEQSQRTNIMILDACRDNPLARNLARTMGTRSTSIGRGLGETKAGVGTLIVYATQPGNVALDGDERNSPFTAALLKHMEAPGLEIRQVITRVRNDVITATREKQVPWDSSSLRGDFYFKTAAAQPAPPPPSVVPRPAAPSAEFETLFWQSIKDSRNAADFRAYLERYPNGVFASLARIRIASIERAAAEEEVRKRAEADAKARADAEAKKKAEDEARKKSEDEKKKAEEAKPDPRRQAQTANSWYAPERRRGLIAFAHGKATLEPGAVAALERLAASLQNQKDYRIALVASADRSEGTAAQQQAISRSRLAAIQRWLAGEGVVASAIRTAIGPARGEGPEHRAVSIAFEAAPEKREERPSPSGARDASAAAELTRRLTGAEWWGILSSSELRSDRTIPEGFHSIVRLLSGGSVRITAVTAGGFMDRTTNIGADDTGSWSVADGRFCITMLRATGGQRQCYSATIDDEGRVLLAGSGFLAGKRFAK